MPGIILARQSTPGITPGATTGTETGTAAVSPRDSAGDRIRGQGGRRPAWKDPASVEAGTRPGPAGQDRDVGAWPDVRSRSVSAARRAVPVAREIPSSPRTNTSIVALLRSSAITITATPAHFKSRIGPAHRSQIENRPRTPTTNIRQCRHTLPRSMFYHIFPPVQEQRGGGERRVDIVIEYVRNTRVKYAGCPNASIRKQSIPE